jgi:microcystin-dependent protein
MKEKLPTPNAPLDEVVYKQVLLTIPANADIERFLWGSVSRIGFFTAWQAYGTMTPEEAAEYIKKILDSRKEFNMLGTIQAVIRDSLHSSMLICDGSSYNKSDYPQLWDVWPASMKDVSTLTLPDLRNLFLLGASLDYSLGDTGGEAEHTLTEGEMPSHSHSYQLPTFNIDVESVGVPDPTGVGQPAFPTSTSSTGGSQPHNNLPPYYAVVYAVIAKVNNG